MPHFWIWALNWNTLQHKIFSRFLLIINTCTPIHTYVISSCIRHTCSNGEWPKLFSCECSVSCKIIVLGRYRTSHSVRQNNKMWENHTQDFFLMKRTNRYIYREIWCKEYSSSFNMILEGVFRTYGFVGLDSGNYIYYVQRVIFTSFILSCKDCCEQYRCDQLWCD